MDKDALRKKLLHQRTSIGALQLETLGRLISEQILRSSWYHEARVIHCFSGTISKGEVPTFKILKEIVGAGKILVMPKVTNIPGIMEHHVVREPEDLTRGKWGILEPAIDDPVAVSDIDLVLVPGLAADRRGNRIGYGRGYYDRFLSEIPEARSMMPVPEIFVLEQIPSEQGDVPVKALATENNVTDCVKRQGH